MYDWPQRKKLRLNGYNYSRDWYYFITICTKNREEFFGEIIDRKMILNDYGKIVENEIFKTPQLRQEIKIDDFVIMPNHLHLIIIIKNKHVECDCIAPKWITPKYIIPKWITPKYTIPWKHIRPWENNGTIQSFPTLSRVIRWLKWTITKQIRDEMGDFNFGWQKSFFDVIIKNQDQLDKTRQYIIDNPCKWAEDKNNVINIK